MHTYRHICGTLWGSYVATCFSLRMCLEVNMDHQAHVISDHSYMYMQQMYIYMVEACIQAEKCLLHIHVLKDKVYWCVIWQRNMTTISCITHFRTA